MILDENNIGHYIAEQGKVIVPKNMTIDYYFSSDSLWLADFDNIENYEEITIEEWEEIKENWSIQNKFVPNMEEEKRNELLKGWEKAVRCALAWKD